MTSDVLVIDDHPLIVETLALALRSVGLTVTGCPDTSTDVVHHMLATAAPRLVVLDLDLGDGRHGETLVPVIRNSGAAVLVLTGAADNDAIGAALAAGAMGWVAKSVPFPDLVAATIKAARGESVTPDDERRRLIAAWRSTEADHRTLHERLARLSPREREVLARLGEGVRAEALAREFVVSVATVRSQIRSILTKLGVNSQLEAVALAHSAGLTQERVAG